MCFRRFFVFILSLVIVFSFSFSVYAVETDENTLIDDNLIESVPSVFESEPTEPTESTEVDSTELIVSDSLVDDDSLSDQVTDFCLALDQTNSILNVIQSQIWIILVVGLIYFVYKFFRIFF